jgi:cobalt-zinc-cadmium efflux system outer membrane protein
MKSNMLAPSRQSAFDCKTFARRFLVAVTFTFLLCEAAAQQAKQLSPTLGASAQANLVKRSDDAKPKASDAAAPDKSATPLVPPRLTLEAATDLLIKNNLSVLAARYNVDVQRAQRIAAGLRPNPTLTVSATQFAIPRVFSEPRYLIKTDPDPVAAMSTYTIEVDQLIERGGKRQLRAAQAESNMQAAEAQVRDALRQQIFQLRQAFYGAVLARENLRVVRENAEYFNRTERILRVQVKEGYTAGVDLKRIELQQLQFQRDVANALQNYNQATRDVLNLIGAGDAPTLRSSTEFINAAAKTSSVDLAQDLEVVEGDLNIIPTLLWIDDLRRLALENRPDVRAAELALEAAKSGLALAEAGRKRDVTIGGQYSRTGSDNTVGVVVGVPLLTAPRANAVIAQAAATKAQAEAQLRLVKTQALTDVEKAFTAYMVARDRVRLFTSSALHTASDVRAIEEAAYREGAKSLLDFLDAQRTYNQTLLDYNQARYDFLMSLYQIEFATGAQIVKK